MAKHFEIHVGDLDPHWQVRLRDDWDGQQVPVNLNTQADTVRFKMRNAATQVLKVDQAITLPGADPTDGLVDYPWAGSDTDTAGTFEVAVVVVKGGKPRTYPSTGFWIVEIHPRIV
jgi:hypothetical protein